MAGKRQLNKVQAKELGSVLGEFNKLSRSYIKLLQQKVKEKQRSVSTLSTMVTGMKKLPETQSSISITALDMKNMGVQKKGGRFRKEKTNWQSDIPGKKKGFMI